MLRPLARRGERGQAAILTIVSLTTLIGMVALVIDVGVWRTERGHMQNAADAAALAASAYLPDHAGQAHGVAQATAAQNGHRYWRQLMSGSVAICDLPVDDTLRVQSGSISRSTDPLAQRIGSDTHSFLHVVEPDPNGGFSKLLDPSCPRLVVMPIVVNNNTGLSDWPSGSGTGVRIVAFALVYIVDWNVPSPGQVNAIMIQTYADYPGGVLGGVN